jgi:hypothetical protein
MILMSALKDVHKGRPAAVLGGGPSLPGDLARLGILVQEEPQRHKNAWHEGHEGRSFKGREGKTITPSPSSGEWVLIAVNYHAWQFVAPHYMVYNDPPAHDPEMEAEVARHRTVLVSSDPSSDVKYDVEVWQGFFSSNTATWLALWLGCAPVVLCGMDCYQGEVKYLHPWKDQASHHMPLNELIRPWREEGRHKLPGWNGKVRAASGPLRSIFGEWNG